jgi:hypothetical protein
MAFPLLIEFGRGTRVYQQTRRCRETAHLADDRRGRALVGFGGMRMGAMDHGRLVFHRVKDLWPEEELSPERARRMTLEPRMVASVAVDGHAVWPLQ